MKRKRTPLFAKFSINILRTSDSIRSYSILIISVLTTIINDIFTQDVSKFIEDEVKGNRTHTDIIQLVSIIIRDNHCTHEMRTCRHFNNKNFLLCTGTKA